MSAEARWLHDLDARRASSRVEIAGGLALRHDTFWAAHDHNKLSVLTGDDGALLADLAEQHLAGLAHRRVELRTDSAALVAGLEAAGFTREDTLLMTLEAQPTRGRGDAVVVELDLGQRVASAVDGWREELPDADPEVWRQLGGRAVTATAASEATFLGVVEDGRVVARADVFVHQGVAQVEEVMTDEAHRGRGLATALVLDGVARARAAGAQTVLLVADVDDWPRRLYERLGFRDRAVLPILSRDVAPPTG